VINTIKNLIIQKLGIILLFISLLLGIFILINQFLHEQEKVKQEMYLQSTMLSNDLLIKFNQLNTYLEMRTFQSRNIDNHPYGNVNDSNQYGLLRASDERQLTQLFHDTDVNVFRFLVYENNSINAVYPVLVSDATDNTLNEYKSKILQDFLAHKKADNDSLFMTENGFYVWRPFNTDNYMAFIGIFISRLDAFLFKETAHNDLNIFLEVDKKRLTLKGEEHKFSEEIIKKLSRSTNDLRTFSDNEYIYYYRKVAPEIIYVTSVSQSKLIFQSMQNNLPIFLIILLAMLIIASIHDYFNKNKHMMQITMDAREKELVSSFYKSRLGHIMNTISEAFVRADSTYTIVEINQAGADMLGYSMNELLGRVVTDFMSKPLDVKVRKNDGMYSCLDVSLLKKNGEVIYGLVNKSTIIKDNPVQKEHYFLISDITELIIAQREAEEANRSKSRFIANLSHEIRTPMNATIGYIYLLEQTKLDSQQKKYLEKMDYASNTLLEIIDEILDFSKLEADKVVAEKIPFNLYHVIRNAASLFENAAYRKDLDYKIVIDHEVPEYIMGDPYRIRQVLINLISNAFKFTRCGEIKVSARLISETESRISSKDEFHKIIQLEVKDTGIGIPASRMDALFDPFVQADDSTTRIFGGTGLGLAICQKLTSLMEGVVYAISSEKEGSNFYVELPIMASSQDEISFQSKIPQGYLHQNSSKKILIVEDNILNQELMVELLKQQGHKVAVANNGKLAIDLLSKEHSPLFDAILMDIQMPIQDGYTTTRIIRSMENYGKVPIVAVTANADKETQIELAQSGMNDFVLKPINAEDLFVKINIWNL
jgi:PAS domain S-box-containing protein